MKGLRIVVLAGALSAAGAAQASPKPAPMAPAAGPVAERVQAFCGPFRCFPGPFWRYRSGAGFRPYRRFGFARARPRFAPFGFRRFGGFGGYGGPGRFGGFRR